jgi:RNA polymerase sigma-70 factor, ECF subfamily
MRDRRDSQEFGRVYDDHVWSVYGFFGYRLASRADAEDLTQRTFERALAAWPRFDASRGAPGPWLMSIARNLLIDHYRRIGSRPEEARADVEQLRESEADPAQELETGISPELASALGRLGDRERELIALRYGADLSGREIAEVTGLSLANVQQILSRTLRALRGSLEGERSEA